MVTVNRTSSQKRSPLVTMNTNGSNGSRKRSKSWVCGGCCSCLGLLVITVGFVICWWMYTFLSVLSTSNNFENSPLLMGKTNSENNPQQQSKGRRWFGGLSKNRRRSIFRKKYKNSFWKWRGRNNGEAEQGYYDEQQHRILQLIAEGELQLIDLTPAVGKRLSQDLVVGEDGHVQYANIFHATFCPLNWTSHELDPSSTPMFRDVIRSSSCHDPTQHEQMAKKYQFSSSSTALTLDLYQVVQFVQTYDQEQQKRREQEQHTAELKNEQVKEVKKREKLLRFLKDPKHFNDKRKEPSDQSANSTSTASTVHVMELGGVVFHESRCGSTLVANLLQAQNPDENIVYSESGPPISILLSLSSQTTANNNRQPPQLSSTTTTPEAQVFQDVIYLMSRTNNPNKRRVFFKIQSIGSWQISLFQNAFPNTPWIYVYRHPVEVLMSQLTAGSHANCVRSQSSQKIPSRIRSIVQKYNLHQTPPEALPMEDYCAAHLASLTESAVEQFHQDELLESKSITNFGGQGIPVNYRDLPQLLVDTIFPYLWNLTMDEASLERIKQVSHSYSKGGNARKRKSLPLPIEKFISPFMMESHKKQDENAADASQQNFMSDSATKQAQASEEIKAAAQIYLQPSYDSLERHASRRQQQIFQKYPHLRQQQEKLSGHGAGEDTNVHENDMDRNPTVRQER